MKRIQVTALGQIQEADITFGDMTIFVGEQATGKSILLQLVKLVLDTNAIIHALKNQGFNWEKNREEFLQSYFGEEMQKIWDSEATKITFDSRGRTQRFYLDQVISRYPRKEEESLFLIPAQRAAILKDGWPANFTSYDVGDPYVVKQFSDQLRKWMQQSRLGSGRESVFPGSKRMDKTLEEEIQKHIFAKAEVKRNVSRRQERLVLEFEGVELPFMEWSAGQKEFMPLLLGLYVLMPLRKTRNRQYNWVIIEEPEAGLHPTAISRALAVFLELMNRGYKVIISTHSPQILELVWAIQHLVEVNAEPTALLEMLGLKSTRFSTSTPSFLNRLAESTFQKKFNTYYFSRQDGGVKVKDISTLDAEDTDTDISDFGGLTAFSTKAYEIVAQAIWKGNS